MQYKKLGSSDLQVSLVSLGTWVFGGDNWGKTDDRVSICTIQKALDRGINLIDTAPTYGNGHSEEIVGKAIKGRRDSIFIATKCGLQKREGKYKHNLRPSEIRKELEGSLSRLGIERVNLYQCHWPDPETPIEDTLEEMLKMQLEGKVEYIGVSNFGLPLLKKALKFAPIISIQLHYSLLERKVEKDILPFCQGMGIGVMTYGSLGGGILTGKYMRRPTFPQKDARRFFYPFFQDPSWGLSSSFISELKRIAKERKKPIAQLAINWILKQQGVTTAITGTRTPKQVEINAASCEWELSKEDFNRIEILYHQIFPEES